MENKTLSSVLVAGTAFEPKKVDVRSQGIQARIRTANAAQTEAAARKVLDHDKLNLVIKL